MSRHGVGPLLREGVLVVGGDDSAILIQRAVLCLGLDTGTANSPGESVLTASDRFLVGS